MVFVVLVLVVAAQVVIASMDVASTDIAKINANGTEALLVLDSIDLSTVPFWLILVGQIVWLATVYHIMSWCALRLNVSNRSAALANFP